MDGYRRRKRRGQEERVGSRLTVTDRPHRVYIFLILLDAKQCCRESQSHIIISITSISVFILQDRSVFLALP